MIGNINYGGRVTDDIDIRLMTNMLSIYITEDILNPSYSYSNSSTYYIPACSSKLEYLDYVQNLPNTDSPELFGLSENSTIRLQIESSSKLLKTILLMQPKDSTQGNDVKENDKQVQTVVNSLLGILPKNIDMQMATGGLFETDPETGVMKSLDNFLKQEIQLFNVLLTTIQKQLKKLIAAIQGIFVMSSDMDSMY